ncbi:hypothetical protein BGZ57DRAFT_442839 [Hyaloscypha finlandica]|nr:hypothetical protein BGZ57DRAFT_442839 [Hyaloscypha finlandica]
MESTREHDFLIKLVLVGSSGVGKTCLIQRYNGDPYNPNISPSISDGWLVRKIEVGGKRVKLQIWDTSGLERFRPLTTSYYRHSNGVFLVYDVASESSFNDIQSYWSQSVNQHAPEKATKILVGNKSDLIEGRVVSMKRGEELADKLGIPFFEVSAKNNLELGKAFHTMTLLITKTLINGNEPGNSQSSVAVDPKANSKSLYLRNLAGLFARSWDQSNRASSDHPGTAITPRQKTTGQYPYRKLDSDAWEMRLLYLDGSTSKDDLLTCFIEYISLIDPGVYTALSYCWGDPHITSTMRIDGYEVKITKNLESALRGVRENRSAKGGILRLWVDALCINQGDKEERSNQVRNMRQIYSKAKEVLCWVGGQEVSPLQVEGLEYLLKNQIEVQTLGTGSSSKETELSSFGNIADEVEKEKFWTENGWALLNEFFSQPYWERVWIIQEITVASYVTVLWGNVEIPWNFVNATLMKLREAEIAKGSGSGSRIRTSSSSKAAHLLEFRDHYYVRRQPIGLLDAMRWSHNTLATDPRDKIYALLGLCHDGTQFVPIPNYRQSANQMLLDMTRNMITLTRSLDMICLRGTRILPKGSPKTPSWVPSWTTFWSGTMTAQESRFSEWHTISDYNPILPWPDTDVLKVWGFRLGTVSGMSSAMRPYGGNESLSPNLSRSHWISSTSTLHQKDPRLDSATPEQMNFNDQIWQTLTMSLVSDKFDSATVRSCFSALWTPEERGAVHNLALIEWIDSNARFKIGEFTLREWSQLKTPGQIPALLANGLEIFIRPSKWMPLLMYSRKF